MSATPAHPIPAAPELPEEIELRHTSLKSANVTTAYKAAFEELSAAYLEIQRDLQENEATRKRLAELLNGMANALRGPASEMTMHDWSRLPREASELTVKLTQVSADRDREAGKVDRLREENDDLAASLAGWMKTAQSRADELATANAAVEESKQQWRMSSVCRELTAQLEQVRSDLAKAKADGESVASALEQLHRIIDSAGVDKLMRGVELGQISWYHKASDAMKDAESVLAARSASPAKEGQ